MPEATVAVPAAEQVEAQQGVTSSAALASPEASAYALPPEVLAEFMRRMETLVTEDDTPVDNIFSAKQQRLLVDSLYVSWEHPQFGKRFLADANVGVYYRLEQGAVVVPDCFVSADVVPIADVWSKPGRSYMVWMYGKPPDVVVEVVSNKEGGELDDKLAIYTRMRVSYYVVYDPQQLLGETTLHVLENTAAGMRRLNNGWMEAAGLGVRLWEGEYEGVSATWLRWCDAAGNILLTGGERARLAEQALEAERQRAEAERQRAEAERQRAERFAARLRALGVDPDAEG
ncbi:MAG: Uma2 family endonuclease [Thermoflexales bacterium]|nr:Uma2 family endonuclease [Thermoflexales bacterium]